MNMNGNVENLPWLLRRAQVVQLTGCDPKTLRKMVECGVLTVFRTPGGQRRYRKSEILKVLAK